MSQEGFNRVMSPTSPSNSNLIPRATRSRVNLTSTAMATLVGSFPNQGSGKRGRSLPPPQSNSTGAISTDSSSSQQIQQQQQANNASATTSAIHQRRMADLESQFDGWDGMNERWDGMSERWDGEEEQEQASIYNTANNTPANFNQNRQQRRARFSGNVTPAANNGINAPMSPAYRIEDSTITRRESTSKFNFSSISKLKSKDNYLAWRDIVFPEITAVGLGPYTTPIPTSTNEQQQQIDHINSAKLDSILNRLVSDEILARLRGCNTQGRPWAKLQYLHDTYGTIPPQVLDDLSLKFSNTEKFNPNKETWDSKYNQIVTLYNDLLLHGAHVDETTLCMTLLRAIRGVKGLDFVHQQQQNIPLQSRSSISIYAAVLAQESSNRMDGYWIKPGSGGKHYFAGERDSRGGRSGRGGTSRKRGGGKSGEKQFGEKQFTPRHGAYCGCTSCVAYFKNIAESDIKPVPKPRNNDNDKYRPPKKHYFTSDYTTEPSDTLYADTCSYFTLIKNREWISHLTECDEWSIGSDHQPIRVMGHGLLNITTVNEKGAPVDLEITCAYAPDCDANLLSIGQIYNDNSNVIAIGHHGKTRYYDGGLNVLTTMQVQLGKNNNLCEVVDWQLTNPVAARHYHTGKLKNLNYSPTPVKMTSREAHLIFYHSDRVVDKLEKDGRIEITDRDNATTNVCEACCYAKMQNAPYKRKSDHWSVVNAKAGEVLVTDNVGPYNVPISFDGSKYFNLIKDKHSGLMQATAFKHRSEVPKIVQERIAWTEQQLNSKVKIVEFDGAKEFTEGDLSKLLQEKGIVGLASCPYEPNQNATAESSVKQVTRPAKAFLQAAQAPPEFFIHAVEHTIELIHRTRKYRDTGKTSYEIQHGKPADLGQLCHRFLEQCKVNRQKPQKVGGKNPLQAESSNCVWLGLSRDHKGHKFYDLDSSKIIHARIENAKFMGTFHDFSNFVEIEEENCDVFDESYSDTSSEHEELDLSENNELGDPGPRPKRASKRPSMYNAASGRYYFTGSGSGTGFGHGFNSGDLLFDEDNPTLQEAIDSNDRDKWIQACKKEWQQMCSAEAVQIIELDTSRKVVGNKLVLKKKYAADGSFQKFKARWVIKGFTQVHGQDFHETFAPVSAANTIRVFFAIVVQRRMFIIGFDVSAAFLNTLLKERVQTSLPPHWYSLMSDAEIDIINRMRNPGILLLKSVYGLRQSGRNWYLDVKDALLQDGFTPTISDPCLFFKWHNNNLILITVYVDDFIIAADQEEDVEEVLKNIESRFKGERNDVTSHLGMRVSYDREAGIITLDQEEFVKKILKSFSQSGETGYWKPVQTPLDVGGEMKESSETEQDFDQKLYQQANGSLAYLATRTRPDISIAWSVVSRRNARPKVSDWNRLKRIFRYLAGTKDYKLVYRRDPDLDWKESLQGYCDASFGGSKSDRKSQSGYFFMIGSMTILWCSKKQSTVALSATEAEYICLASGVQEGCWISNILGEIGLGVQRVVVHEDNMGAIHIAHNNGSHGRVKHIDIKYHYIKEKVEQGSLLIKYCKTDVMVADVLTKALAQTKFNRFRALLGVVKFEVKL